MRYAKGFKRNYFSLNAICALNAQICMHTALVRVNELHALMGYASYDDTPIDEAVDEPLWLEDAILVQKDYSSSKSFSSALPLLPFYPLLHVTFHTLFRRS